MRNFTYKQARLQSLLCCQPCQGLQAVAECFKDGERKYAAQVSSVKLLKALDYFGIPDELRPAGIRLLSKAQREIEDSYHGAMVTASDLLQQLITKLDSSDLAQHTAPRFDSKRQIAGAHLSMEFSLQAFAGDAPFVLLKGESPPRSSQERKRKAPGGVDLSRGSPGLGGMFSSCQPLLMANFQPWQPSVIVSDALIAMARSQHLTIAKHHFRAGEFTVSMSV